MAKMTQPMPDQGNRRKLSSGTLTGGIRRDIDPTQLDLTQQRQAESLVSMPRGLERTNAYASAASLSTSYPVALGPIGAPFAPIPEGSLVMLASNGTVVQPGSTTDLYYELPVTTDSIDLTTASSIQSAFFTTQTLTVDGVAYYKSFRNEYNLQAGDVIVRSDAYLVGSGLNIATTGVPAVAAMSSTRAGFFDNTNDSLRAYDWNGSTWSLVGSGLAISTTGTPYMCALSSTRIVLFLTGTGGQVYDFNGSTWSATGSAVVPPFPTSVVGICTLTSTDIAIVTAGTATGSIRTYRFNGSTWSLVGAELPVIYASGSAITALDSSHVVVGTVATSVSSQGVALTTYYWDGAVWVQTGNSGVFSTATVMLPRAMATIGNTDVLVMSVTSDLLTRYRFNGTSWREILPQTAITAGTGASIATMTGSDFVFIDDTNDQLRYYRTGGASSQSATVDGMSLAGLGVRFSSTTIPDGTYTAWTIRYKVSPLLQFDQYKTPLWDSTVFNNMTLVSALSRPFGVLDVGGYVTTVGRAAADFAWPVSGTASDTLFSITARTIEVFQNFIFIGCTDEQLEATISGLFPNRVRWSSAFDPLTDWSNPLSFLDVPNANGEIIKLLTSKQFLMCYCETGIFYGSLSGDPNAPVAFQELNTDNTGLVGVRAICQAKQRHFFCGRENVYMLEGLEVVPIGDPIVQQTLRSCTNASYIQMVYDARKQRVLVGFPIADSANIDVVYALSLQTQAWTLAFSRSTKILSVAQSSRLQGVFTTQDIYITSLSGGNYTLLKEQADSAVPASSTGVSVTFETGDIGGDDLSQIKEFFGLWVKIAENQAGATRTASIVFTVALSTDHGVNYIQLPSLLYITPDKQEGYVTFKRISNHLRIKLTSTSLVAPYTLVSYTVDVKGMQATESLLTQGINNPNT